MFSNTSCVYGGKANSRCLVAVEGDPDRHRFMVGSSTLKEENEVRLRVCVVRAYPRA